MKTPRDRSGGRDAEPRAGGAGRRDAVLRWIGHGAVILLALRCAPRSGGPAAKTALEAEADWAKSFDDGTARLGRSPVLLIGASFGMVSLDSIASTRVADCVDPGASDAGCLSLWFIQTLAVTSIAALLVSFVVQFVIAAPCYVAAAKQLARRTKFHRHVQAAGNLMICLLAAAASSVLFGFVLLADSAIKPAMIHAIGSDGQARP